MNVEYRKHLDAKYRKHLDELAVSHGGYSKAAQFFFNEARDFDGLAGMVIHDGNGILQYASTLARNSRKLAADLVEAGKQPEAERTEHLRPTRFHRGN